MPGFNGLGYLGVDFLADVRGNHNIAWIRSLLRPTRAATRRRPPTPATTTAGSRPPPAVLARLTRPAIRRRPTATLRPATTPTPTAAYVPTTPHQRRRWTPRIRAVISRWIPWNPPQPITTTHTIDITVELSPDNPDAALEPAIPTITLSPDLLEIQL